MADQASLIDQLVTANRILAREGVCDALGHISVRNPANPHRYFLSCSRSPELVAAGDIMEFELDGTAVDARDRRPYLERFIHGAIYETRPDVQSVVHNHSYAVIPFGITNTPIRPVQHTCGGIGAHIPVWDMRDRFGDTNMLVVNMEQGRDLAATLAGNVCVLMRGHGCTVTAPDIPNAVMTAVYLQVNARMQMDAMRMGEVTYLSPGEIAATGQSEMPASAMARIWQYFASRATDGK